MCGADTALVLRCSLLCRAVTAVVLRGESCGTKMRRFERRNGCRAKTKRDLQKLKLAAISVDIRVRIREIKFLRWTLPLRPNTDYIAGQG